VRCETPEQFEDIVAQAQAQNELMSE